MTRLRYLLNAHCCSLLLVAGLSAQTVQVVQMGYVSAQRLRLAAGHQAPLAAHNGDSPNLAGFQL
jgi:hypothetical protein